MVFHSLRKHFKIELAEYVQSLCSDASLREMSSPGKSGAGFYISHNDRYFVKTLTKEEMRMLRIMLPKYYTHCATYKHTMLTRLYGLHRVDSMNGGAPVRRVGPPRPWLSINFRASVDMLVGHQHGSNTFDRQVSSG